MRGSRRLRTSVARAQIRTGSELRQRRARRDVCCSTVSMRVFGGASTQLSAHSFRELHFMHLGPLPLSSSSHAFAPSLSPSLAPSHILPLTPRTSMADIDTIFGVRYNSLSAPLASSTDAAPHLAPFRAPSVLYLRSDRSRRNYRIPEARICSFSRSGRRERGYSSVGGEATAIELEGRAAYRW